MSAAYQNFIPIDFCPFGSYMNTSTSALAEKSRTFRMELGGKELTVSVGVLAQQANGSALVQYGETIVLVTAVMGSLRENIDYFPLSVDYEERLYAAGMIKGSRFIKREGRPTDDAILTGRLVDRTIRPLFDHRLRNEVQVIITVLSFDTENDADVLALIGASAALSISNIPWNGPIAGVRVGKVGEQFIINPTYAERDTAALDMVVSGTADRINMLESGAQQVSEEDIVRAAEAAHQEISKLTAFINDIRKEIGKEKLALSLQEDDQVVKQAVHELAHEKISAILLSDLQRLEKMDEVNKFAKEVGKMIAEKYPDAAVHQASRFIEEEINDIVHQNVLAHNRRIDGRKLDELRPIWTDAGILPRTHGSGLFNRGETQALSVLTLGEPALEQSMESMEFVGTKRFIHHYNFPPFCSGETGPMRGPGRREIGHGALAERAIEAILPTKEQFPYAIRIVTEILSSNGSTSMASVCGSTLALMDAGVPIVSPAAGIAMGLMTGEQGNYKVLTDIQGPEDHHGDMDLKVAGTRSGVTAMQMDVKIDGITPQMLRDAMTQARKARMEILDKIEQTLSAPRDTISPWAPKIAIVKINPDQIGLVIGSGGKTINEISDRTGATINIEQDGSVYIASRDITAVREARTIIENMTREVAVGDTFSGKVVKITDFGAFIELAPGKDGLLHKSEIRRGAHFNVGDTMNVTVIRVEAGGKIALSQK